ncbi:MAG TPA: ABC transporter substrate-binding protein, partial [Dehalococcoidales bacterium]|nr:ABC transporter substrate-binding protein [Dehalococcoidales bacterium]
DQSSDYPADAKTKTNLGSYTSPSIEKIIALNPDLILATAVHQAKVIPILESMGYTVLALDPKTIEEVLDAITLVGKVTNTQAEAAELVASLGKRVKAVTDQTKGLADAKRPKVFYIVWYNPLMGPGKGTFQDDMIIKAGGTNIASSLNGFATISLEAVIAANPEIMIAGISMGTDMTDQNVAFMRNEPRLKDSPARLNNRIYMLDGNIVSRPGPRIVDALEQFAKFIHPELFK